MTMTKTKTKTKLKEILVGDKTIEALKTISEKKVRLQEQFAYLNETEQSILTALLEANGVSESVKITGIEENKLKYEDV